MSIIASKLRLFTVLWQYTVYPSIILIARQLLNSPELFHGS